MTNTELLGKCVNQMALMWLTCKLSGSEEGDLEDPTALINLVNAHIYGQLEMEFTDG